MEEAARPWQDEEVSRLIHAEFSRLYPALAPKPLHGSALELSFRKIADRLPDLRHGQLKQPGRAEGFASEASPTESKSPTGTFGRANGDQRLGMEQGRERDPKVTTRGSESAPGVWSSAGRGTSPPRHVEDGSRFGNKRDRQVRDGSDTSLQQRVLQSGQSEGRPAAEESGAAGLGQLVGVKKKKKRKRSGLQLPLPPSLRMRRSLQEQSTSAETPEKRGVQHTSSKDEVHADSTPEASQELPETSFSFSGRQSREWMVSALMSPMPLVALVKGRKGHNRE